MSENWKKRKELPTFDPATPGIGLDGGAIENCPKSVNTTRRVSNVLYVAGQGPRPAEIMFIMPALQEEDAKEGFDSMNEAFSLKTGACYIKSQAGGLFKNILEEVGLTVKEQYVTAMVKWLLPKAQRGRPKAAAVKWAEESFYNEIREVKPKIIVCLGKSVFDKLVGVKLNLHEIVGGWFYSEEFECRIYPMDTLERPLLKPEYLEKMRVDLREVRRMRDMMNGLTIPKIPTHYQTISNAAELGKLVSFLTENNHRELAVDCEWGGQHHVDGRLRSLQLCWAPGQAAYIRFMDEEGNYAFDVSYVVAGQILSVWLARPEVLYIGHQFAADAPWINQVLGLPIYRKCCHDTLYAQQVIDENAEGKLERLALAMTDLGRYDTDITIWKKTSGKFCDDDGYAKIPDALIILYGCKDVDATWRIRDVQIPEMLKQGIEMVLYYQHLFLPFVTDIFSNFTIVGLPMDVNRLDGLRELFLLARDRLDIEFRTKIVIEARLLFLNKLVAMDAAKAAELFVEIETKIQEGNSDAALGLLKAFTGPERLMEVLPFFEHYFESPSFNIRSVDAMRRWLFEVKGFTPIKSTNNKDKGLPSMDWAKVLAMPEASRKEVKPSTDKQTLKVLAEKDSMIGELLQLNAIGNLTKAFLRPAEVDDEGNLVKEEGLHSWIGKDGRVHGQFSATDTGRPRSWKPNSLNWPSWLNEQVSRGVLNLIEKEPIGSPIMNAYLKVMGGEAEAMNPEKDWKKKGKWQTPPSIRSTVSAQSVKPLEGSQGWCFTESDYQTAEVRGLAYISGDSNLIRLINEEDAQFCAMRDGDLEKDRVRMFYAEDYGIAQSEQNPEFIMTHLKDDGKRVKVTEDDLHRNPDGTLWHPRHDLHWNLAEFTLHKPREVLHKKKHRDGLGKTGNFKSAYGSSGSAMERSIEAETGAKPDMGTGDAILKSLMLRQPVSDAFLKTLELTPASTNPHLYASSGRIRHLATHDRDASINQRLRDNVNSSLGRICRNFFMQENVASTASRAALWLNEYYISRDMKSRVCMLLYDSVVTLGPVEERHACVALHDLFMFRINAWTYNGRDLVYPIDTELNWRWSARPNKADQKKLDGTEWATDIALTEKVKQECTIMLQFSAPVMIDDRGLWSKIGRGFTFDPVTGKRIN